jgi:methionyl-tRNA formyltransferase
LLLAGTERRTPQRIEPGQYFGRRRPEDGRIDWRRPALEIHNLVRAVAPPFPGASTAVSGERWIIERTRITKRTVSSGDRARFFGDDGRCYAACHDGVVLEVLAAATASGPVDLRALAAELRKHPVSPG